MLNVASVRMYAQECDTFPTYSVVSGPLTVTETSVTDSLKGPLAEGDLASK